MLHKKIPLRDSRPPRCMISKWQGGASLVHLLWHFSLSAYHRAGHLIRLVFVLLLLLLLWFIYTVMKPMQSGSINMWQNRKEMKIANLFQ